MSPSKSSGNHLEFEHVPLNCWWTLTFTDTNEQNLANYKTVYPKSPNHSLSLYAAKLIITLKLNIKVATNDSVFLDLTLSFRADLEAGAS